MCCLSFLILPPLHSIILDERKGGEEQERMIRDSAIDQIGGRDGQDDDAYIPDWTDGWLDGWPRRDQKHSSRIKGGGGRKKRSGNFCGGGIIILPQQGCQVCKSKQNARQCFKIGDTQEDCVKRTSLSLKKSIILNFMPKNFSQKF